MNRKLHKPIIRPLSEKALIQMYRMKSYLLLNNTVKPVRKVYAVFIAVGLGLLLGMIPIQAEGGDAIYAYELIFTSFTKGKILENKLVNVLITYGLLALGTAIAFKAGVLNIGATGQFMAGGFLVLILGIDQGENFTTSEAIPVMILLSAAGGATVAILAAVLKVLFRINEVVSTLMINWIVFYIFKIALFDMSIYRDDKGTGGSLPISDSFTFNVGSIPYLLPLLMFLSLIVIIWLLLTFTTYGFKIKACGKNFSAAKANGISVNSVFISTFAISGALCGLAGAIFYVFRTRVNLGTDLLPPEGFNAIAISLLAFNEPLGVVFTALFFSIIEVGKPAANSANIDPQAMTLVISMIIFLSALAVIFLNARPLKWLIELFVAANSEKSRKAQDELDKLEKEYQNNVKIKMAINELKKLDKKIAALKLDVNELSRIRHKKVRLGYIARFSQLHNNMDISYDNLANVRKGGKPKRLIWNTEESITLDQHPLVKRRQELNRIIISFNVKIEDKKAELKRAHKETIREWYKNLSTPALFFMRVVA